MKLYFRKKASIKHKINKQHTHTRQRHLQVRRSKYLTMTAKQERITLVWATNPRKNKNKTQGDKKISNE